ncbi:hypothetical protein SNOG_03715 [Parastagonospora nodorum SN15]|uniref:Uncharacterized protein n=1 Tax=Phaeosphaeria nodorum (strain SN15 / ATCC MYA-4574 / FGSC 10173) TaxID=321614 RepID=Q0UWZ9_PHANO|nr:hypothetical protein SNOG_03715 [Parastagonospora nodorum SN15]EAT88920.1 hypothetical protein SNOG_03715 [Parastagonospora nodorum SN15]
MLRNSQGLAPNFQNIGQPITGPLPGVQPPVQAYAKKRHVSKETCLIHSVSLRPGQHSNYKRRLYKLRLWALCILHYNKSASTHSGF